MTTISHPALTRIHEAVRLIMAEAFEPLKDHYTEGAVLIVKPRLEVRGRAAIRQVMQQIAAFFTHGRKVSHQQMQVLAAGDPALVLCKTLVSAPGKEDDLRYATYIYQRETDGQWRCCIDNSYGHRVLDGAV